MVCLQTFYQERGKVCLSVVILLDVKYLFSYAENKTVFCFLNGAVDHSARSQMSCSFLGG